MTRIILVRHGQTEWNHIERFRGRIDIPLNATGLWQADQTGRWIHQRWEVAAVYASPLGRAMATAAAIAKYCNLNFQSHDDLIDFHFGDWQGKTPAEIQDTWPDLYATWLAEPGAVQMPGGESLEDLRLRTARLMQEIVTSYPRQTVALVGHTVVNRAILLNVLQLPTNQFWQLGQSNCAINLIDWLDDKFILVSMNETGHLNGRTAERRRR
jgi:probable phosphoglycerate mutase